MPILFYGVPGILYITKHTGDAIKISPIYYILMK